MDERVRIEARVDVWVEVSEDGRTWHRADRGEVARETGRTYRELRAILATYTAIAEAMGARFSPVRPWVRVVMQERHTSQVIAVIPRRWDGRRYTTTGGEWMITDTPNAYQSWNIDLLRARVACRV